MEQPPVVSDSIKVQQTGVGRFLLSGKQKVQSLNLKNFFTTRPFQISACSGIKHSWPVIFTGSQ